MEVLEMLERLPAIAEAMQRGRDDGVPQQDGKWTLVAREPGQLGTGVVPLHSYGEGRALAVALSDLGFVVTVQDGQDQVRLRIWPPAGH